MNNKIEIDKIDGVWTAFLKVYDPLPFGEFSTEIKKTITSDSYSNLLKELAELEIFDLINKNQ